jgi:hypothetical protein
MGNDPEMASLPILVLHAVPGTFFFYRHKGGKKAVLENSGF